MKTLKRRNENVRRPSPQKMFAGHVAEWGYSEMIQKKVLRGWCVEGGASVKHWTDVGERSGKVGYGLTQATKSFQACCELRRKQYKGSFCA